MDEQLDSILKQSFKDWRVLLHDDGSTDGTLDVINKFINRYPQKFFLFDDGLQFGHAKENFVHLITLSSAPYVAFCDQDDVWLANHLEKRYNEITVMEKKSGKETPILACSDTILVDHNLKLISNSGWISQRIGPNISNTTEFLTVRNYIYGCTTMVNRAAIEVGVPVPKEAIMHDWWLGICVMRNGGKVIVLETATILYRQHSNNAMGAIPFSLLSYFKKVFKIKTVATDFWKAYRMGVKSKVIKNLAHFLVLKMLIAVKVLRFNEK